MVSLYVNFQLLALSELFRADWALVILDVKMDLFVRFHDMLVKEALSAALKWAFELVDRPTQLVCIWIFIC